MIWIPIWIQFFSYKILLCTPRFYKLKFIEKNYTQKICTPKFCTQILHAWVGFQFEFNFFIQNIALLEFLHIKFYVYKVSMYIFPCIKFIYSNMSFYFFVFFLKSTPYGTGAPRPHVGNCALSPQFPYGSIQFERKINRKWDKLAKDTCLLVPITFLYQLQKRREHSKLYHEIYNRKHFTNILH